ncbi:hypothetical protein HZR84_12235 [Hyphobacterium sp. CCMP332]|nr:hypothetical protein HZR84_12235 [Hyphobacterium sp. CCMP332]
MKTLKIAILIAFVAVYNLQAEPSINKSFSEISLNSDCTSKSEMKSDKLNAINLSTSLGMLYYQKAIDVVGKINGEEDILKIFKVQHEMVELLQISLTYTHMALVLDSSNEKAIVLEENINTALNRPFQNKHLLTTK